MHEDSLGAPTRRRTNRGYALGELQHLGMELADEGAYLSSDRTHWRGLSGHDPLDDVPDEEFAERQWEDWHDASEVDEERPQRRRPSGRGVDIISPAESAVTVRVDPAIAAEFAARQTGATPGASWDVVNAARVTIVGDFKVWQGKCAQCETEFEQRRPRSQRRRWAKLCGAPCAAEWERTRTRESKRRQRSTNAA
ncbi:hypothetical protein AB0M86_48530 [Streptomyces sp. NPDC051639]|uniref:hypothetical protein n=1 Tax=Streptomyces sp. NPDC051639 TaxID=3155671 RepID=UPI00344543F4